MSSKGGSGAPRDDRFTEPLYTVGEAARYLGVSTGTFRDWVYPRGSNRALVHSVPSPRAKEAEIPFIGLAEGLVVAALRRVHGVSMQYIRRALHVLNEEIGVEYALASRRLYQHGAKILFDYRSDEKETHLLVELASSNYVFTGVVQDWLELIEWDADAYAARLMLPLTAAPVLQADPSRAFGKPTFVEGGARMEDVLSRIKAGDAPPDVAADFGVPLDHVWEVLRAFIPEAA